MQKKLLHRSKPNRKIELGELYEVKKRNLVGLVVCGILFLGWVSYLCLVPGHDDHDKWREWEMKKAAMEKAMSSSVKVVYCAKSISKGKVVTLEDLKEAERESSKVPDNAPKTAAECVGKLATRDIAPDEMLIESDLTETGELSGDSAR